MTDRIRTLSEGELQLRAHPRFGWVGVKGQPKPRFSEYPSTDSERLEKALRIAKKRLATIAEGKNLEACLAQNTLDHLNLILRDG